MNNPYYHWVLPNYLVDYNNRYNDYLRYNYETSNTKNINNYSPVGQQASYPQSQQPIWNNYLYQQQSQPSPQQPQQNNRQIPPVIESYQISPKSTQFMPITLQLPPKTGDPSTPLVTPTNPQQAHQCLQISSSKSTTDDPLNILKTQPDNYLRSSQTAPGYYDPYMYTRNSQQMMQAQQQQTKVSNQHYYQNSKNSKYT
jgi:hypothetical protein